ncbi:MAG: polysaccharide deacetylase family protein [Candidatus Nitrohelix vancouverensis]|uniref:Polysaccharide deacetylase family protein n=1 Tax=Candidatus Nitrohelix vancouverensis TaxID=2705534 RepID=A0A7T0C043_9BACT|nr:MAG: polysaccharide deacetylase family protein [Candidatus Nitrohelix vancouverensis]
METSPEYLDRLIQFLKRDGFQFVSLHQVCDYLKNAERPDKFIAVTFDDGYADNFLHAWPILQRHEVPFTIYVTTQFPDGDAILWWYLLEDVIHKEKRVDWDFQGASFRLDCSDRWSKEEAFHQLRNFFSLLDGEQLEKALHDFFGKRRIDLHEKTKELALSWNQITEMNRDPLVDIGAHTVSHPALSQLNERNAISEIMQSKERIESHTGEIVRHFSYPFGTVREAGPREFKLAADCGFDSSTTTRFGNIFPEHRDHIQNLPRIPINPKRDGENPESLRLWVHGTLPCLINQFRRLPAE